MNLLKSSLPFFLLGLITSLVYQETLNNDFIGFDDPLYIVHNPHITAFTWENIQWMFSQVYLANWHPLTWLSHALDYALYGLNPWGHHLTNNLLHAFNVLLVFCLVRLLIISRPSLSSQSSPTLLAASIAAGLFAIHPQHVEVVAWVSERKELLCMFFVLWTLLMYIFYTTTQKISWYWIAVLCFSLALLAKPMAVTLPVILFLLDIYPLQRTSLLVSAKMMPTQKLLLEKIPFMILTIVSVIITLQAQAQTIIPIEIVNLETRLLNALNSLIIYISKFLFPVSLSPFYPYPDYNHPQDYYPAISTAVAVVLMTILSIYLWFRERYYWLMAWLIYLVTLSPVLGIIQVGRQAMADRYAYLPTLPFYILIGLGISYVRPKFLRLSLMGGVLLISIGLIWLTQQQIKIWRQDLIFWSYIVSRTPQSVWAQHMLGDAYFNVHDYDRAIVHYELIKNFRMENNHKKLALAYLNSNRLAKALEVYQEMLDFDLDTHDYKDVIYSKMGWIYYQQGLLNQAQHFLEQSLQINPHSKEVQELFARITGHEFRSSTPK